MITCKHNRIGLYDAGEVKFWKCLDCPQHFIRVGGTENKAPRPEGIAEHKPDCPLRDATDCYCQTHSNMEHIFNEDFQEGKQPCKNFTPEDAYELLLFTHECPVCWGVRVFCKNCHKDHHAGGWETCSEDNRKESDEAI